jgi:LPS export ABC transporter protein LptC
MRLRAALGYALLILLAAGSWWLARPDQAPAPQSAAVAQPGYYLHAAELDQTDPAGRINLRVHASDAQQTTLGGDIALTGLDVEYLPEPGRRWLMTAAGGTLPPAGRTLLLAGNVRLSAPEEGAALVRTEHLHLDLDTELATTADAVRIEMPPHAVTARGLRADLKRDTLQLESSVDGTFTR